VVSCAWIAAGMASAETAQKSEIFLMM
jgi:hypothetical protein